MEFNLCDESGMTADELETTRLALIEYLKPLAPWNFGECQFTVGEGEGVPIYITTRKRVLSNFRYLAGYHAVENGKPVIYINPKTDRFGYFRAGRAGRPAVPASPYIPARKIGTFTLPARPSKVARAAVPARPDTMRGGQLSTIAHEVAEVLGDPLIQTYANPDSQGRRYLKEITDPMHGLHYREVINGVNCILPINTLPNWYELGSEPPYDTAGWATAPFQKAPRGYAYFKDALGKFIRV